MRVLVSAPIPFYSRPPHRVSLYGEEHEPERRTVDPELVGRARRGEAAAVESLARELTPALWRLAARLADDPTLAEDLVTETLYRGIAKLGRLRHADAVRSWFRKILVNLWRDGLRARGAPDISLEDAPEPSAPPLADPALLAESAELEQAVAEETARLPAQQRAALALRLDGELSIGEIADVLGSTPDRVKANLWHARRRLRERLARLYGRELAEGGTG